METKTKITAEEAQALLREEAERRTQDCMAEVQTVLDKHRCRLQAVLVLTGGQMPLMEIRVVPLEG